ncbi:MAG: hypothetical protein JXR91_12390 [Deltaproteobacteria bacterium]|nr:hypothetical protein [Deltaproteobacteria bacterium]
MKRFKNIFYLLIFTFSLLSFNGCGCTAPGCFPGLYVDVLVDQYSDINKCSTLRLYWEAGDNVGVFIDASNIKSFRDISVDNGIQFPVPDYENDTENAEGSLYGEDEIYLEVYCNEEMLHESIHKIDWKTETCGTCTCKPDPTYKRALIQITIDVSNIPEPDSETL